MGRGESMNYFQYLKNMGITSHKASWANTMSVSLLWVDIPAGLVNTYYPKWIALIDI